MTKLNYQLKYEGLVALGLPLALWHCEQDCLGGSLFWAADNKARIQMWNCTVTHQKMLLQIHYCSYSENEGNLFYNNRIKYMWKWLSGWTFYISVFLPSIMFLFLIDLKYTSCECAVMINSIYRVPVCYVPDTTGHFICYTTDAVQ